MSIHPARSSKFWLYTFAYLVLLAAIVFLFLFDWPERVEKVEEPPAKPVVEEEPEPVIFCEEASKGTLEGVLALMPVDQLFSRLSVEDRDCADKMCQELTYGGKLSPEFDGADECISATTQLAVDYHNGQLEELPLISFFFDAGKSELEDVQKADLRAFLRAFKKAPADYGVIIVGRASSVGDSETNYRLSERRALSIQYLAESELPGLAHSDFIYFGDRPPVLDQQLATTYGISRSEYQGVDFGRGRDPDYLKRLNQSAILVVYEVSEDPFGIAGAGR